MEKLVNSADLKSAADRLAGASPAERTIYDPIKPHESVLNHIDMWFLYKDGSVFSKFWNCEIGFIHNVKCRFFISVKPKGLTNKSISRAHINWYLCKGVWPEKELDHIDRNKLNDKIENLRYSNRSVQQTNKHWNKNKQGYKGIYKVKRGYQVQLWKDNVRYIVGYYPDKELAYSKYVEKYKELWGCDPT